MLKMLIKEKRKKKKKRKKTRNKQSKVEKCMNQRL